jgi:hypothetical protein
MEQRLDRVQPNLVARDGDLVPARLAAVLAGDRRPELPVGPRGRLEEQAADIRGAGGGGFREPWSH